MTREQTTIRLPAELKRELQREADERGYTLSDLIMFILWKHYPETNVQE
nr:MAG TPA: antitoxin [Caudoviricetes sp.]